MVSDNSDGAAESVGDRLAPGRHTAELDGVRHVYHVAGQGPVCVAHSGGPGIDPGYLRTPLLETGLTMVYLEPAGSGGSALVPGGDYSMPRYAGFVRDLVDHLGLPKAHFLGHSHGGSVGLQFALDHAVRLDKLVVYDGVPTNGPDYVSAATAGMERFLNRFPGRPRAREAHDAWHGMISGAQPIVDDKTYVDVLRRMLPAYFADFWNSTADTAAFERAIGATHDPHRRPSSFDVRDRLSSIDSPTLVLVGEHDFICGPDWAELIADEVPQASLHRLAASAHFAHLEQATEFAASVADFLLTSERTERQPQWIK
ncbi:alpha/beta fold hydrolase [Lentzea cavernae]|uniref:Hydrolase n=1 Tax=Lentzea cavernae TaxID=2020703 RepID=A0ABQ3M5N2_9PSEU|nr:alpha/beta hydrolase [Lentzea cavernae]GHH32288.1 hydrolase [Lentzea cavernae]